MSSILAVILSLRLLKRNRKLFRSCCGKNLQYDVPLLSVSTVTLGSARFTLLRSRVQTTRTKIRKSLKYQLKKFFYQLLYLNMASHFTWQLRWCYALSSIKTQHKTISAKHEKVTLLVRTIPKKKHDLIQKLRSHYTLEQQHKNRKFTTNQSTITIKHNRSFKIFKCFPAYLGLSKIGWVPIWGKTYRE